MSNSVFGHSAIEDRSTDFLDKMIPLVGASHADVVNYAVDVPLRFADCFAALADGRTARFKDTSRFIGWSDANGRRTLLFRSGFRRIEIHTNAGLPAGHIRDGRRCRVTSWLSLNIGGQDLLIRNDDKPIKSRLSGARKFTARDGSQLVIRRLSQLLATTVRRPTSPQYSFASESSGFARSAHV
jgi:hypothetical protein